MDENIVEQQRNRTKWKDLLSFWIFGLCNNFGYVVMLTAAEDILSSNSFANHNNSFITERECTTMSTGTILLADIIPSFIIKLFSPFLPYHTSSRVFISCITSIFSFLIVAIASSKSVAILGVALTSFASGLGEPTFLAHSSKYNENVLSTWSSGTGAAGIVGAILYSLMRYIGLSSYETLILMILVPMIELLVFTFVLSKPRRHVSIDNSESQSLLYNERELNPPEIQTTLSENIAYLPRLMIYFIPLALVYFFEYFINQGLFELIIFKDKSFSPKQQYRWYQVIYQIGVFVSRSSVNIIQIKRTWIMAMIQGIIMIIFMTEAIYLYIPSIFIIFIIIFIEGLQGGLAYVNTYYRMNREIDSEYKSFSMNAVAFSDSLGIILAGFLAIPTHNWICQLPVTSYI